MEQKVQREVLSSLAKALGLELTGPNVVGDVVRLGNKVVIPKDASIPEVIDNLKREYQRESQIIHLQGELNVPPWDGALAVKKAVLQTLGLVLNPDDSSGEIEIEVELGKTERITWGEFSLPGMGSEASIDCGVARNNDGVMVFKATIHCQRRFEDRAKLILDLIREITATESLHKGKAFTMQFKDANGDLLVLPKPRFFPISAEKPIFRRDLEDSIQRNIFVPLRHREALVAMGESLKRGVLFAGEYGTGKTMLASYIAGEAVANGWTFIYVKEPDELPLALQYAQRYQPCVVFAEDVDRISGVNRTNAVNNLLNQLDGIDSKATAILTVLTTNHADNINQAMRRPGRIDLVLHVLPPDAEAVGRMIHHFAAGDVGKKEDLSEATKILDGFSPAFVHETVKRAKLEALRRTNRPFSQITGVDLAKTAHEVAAERAFFQPKLADNKGTVEHLGHALQEFGHVLSQNAGTGKANGAIRAG